MNKLFLPLCNGARSITLLLLSVLSLEITSPNSMSPKCNTPEITLYMELTSPSLKPTHSKAAFNSWNFSILFYNKFQISSSNINLL